MDDRTLVSSCLRGDAASVGTFCERFQRLLFSVCWRMLGHRQDAEDVAQESLVRALRHLDRWDRNRPIRPWLVAIAVNRCRTRLARRQREAQPQSMVESAASGSTRRSVADLAEELQRALQQLRPEYRDCFLLFHDSDLSVQEVAQALGCPEGTVKTWLYRARRELAEMLKSRGVVSEVGHELHRD